MRGWARWTKALVASSLRRDAASLPPGALDCVVATNEHGLYCVPRSSRHRPVAQAILQSRVWEPDTLDLLRSVDSDGDIVHAGTYFGDFLPALARSRGDGAIVWAFEPNRENYRCAQITTLLNDLGNVVLTHAALDAQAGTAVLATSDPAGMPSGGASHIVGDPSQAGTHSHEEVDLVSVDQALGSDRRVAVIQLDVEGHEQQALAGAMLTIERCRPLIVLESLPETSWFAANLAPLGYKLDGSVDLNTVIRVAE